MTVDRELPPEPWAWEGWSVTLALTSGRSMTGRVVRVSTANGRPVAVAVEPDGDPASSVVLPWHVIESARGRKL